MKTQHYTRILVISLLVFIASISGATPIANEIDANKLVTVNAINDCSEDEELVVEDWMTDDDIWFSEEPNIKILEVKDITEREMEISDWMLNDSFWKLECKTPMVTEKI